MSDEPQVTPELSADLRTKIREWAECHSQIAKLTLQASFLEKEIIKAAESEQGELAEIDFPLAVGSTLITCEKGKLKIGKLTVI